jgi:glutamate racemase
VAEAARVSKNGKIGILTGRAAAASGALEQAAAAIPGTRLFTSDAFLLFSMIEAGWAKRPETVRVVKKATYPLRLSQVDTLVLGDTTLEPLRPIIQVKIGRRVRILGIRDAGLEILSGCLDAGPAENVSSPAGAAFFVTDRSDSVLHMTARVLGKSTDVKVVRIPEGV